MAEIDGKDVWESISKKDVASPREDVLLVYDRDGTVDYAGYAAIMGRYKLVSGEWPFNDVNNYYLVAGDRLNSVDELERRRLSAKAHAVLERRGLVRNVSSDWREEATVTCSWGENLRCNDGPCSKTMASPTGADFLEVEVVPVDELYSCDFAHEPCLFDLRDDPCETLNVAREYPEIVQKISAYINTFEAAEPASPFEYVDCLDRNANPAREDPPVWKPWATTSCDGLLGEKCPVVLTRNDSDVCPPGGDIQHEPSF